MSLARTLRTVRHLRSAQLGAQLRHWLAPATPPTGTRSELDGYQWVIERLAAPPPPAPGHASWNGVGRIELVGRVVDFGSIEAIDWAHAAEGPLWAYQLHFFEWVRARDVAACARAEAIAAWLRTAGRGAHRAARASPSWDPHPISVRALSWLKLRFSGELPEDFAGSAADARLRASLAAQLDWLSRNVETRLQANHLLENWIAVVAGGLALDGPDSQRWLAVGVAGLCEQLEEQIGDDGTHYERSPMYHAIVLEHLLDLLSLARSAGGHAPSGLSGALSDVCGRMRSALEMWCHPDGEIALFGDAAFGVAQHPAVLARYADALGIASATRGEPDLLRSARYARLETPALCLIASVGGPSPPCQPGHAHCDALSFELSISGERVITDTGVREYVAGASRDRARATRSHATLEVGGFEQAELWSAHRVGGRPRVELVGFEAGSFVEATCAGWRTPGTIHRRRFEVSGDELRICDALEGRPERVCATLPLAPGLEPRLSGDTVALVRDGQVCATVELPRGMDWKLERAPYYPGFGREQERSVLVGCADRFESGEWRIRPGG